MRLSPTLLLSLLLSAGATGSPLYAQAIVGRVYDTMSGSPVALASVQLVDETGALVTGIAADTAGRFRLRAPRPGEYRLRVSALGYTAFESDGLRLGNLIEMQVELRLSASAIPVQPIRVVGQRTYNTSGRAGEFYKRAEWVQRTGFGRVYTRADLERIQPPSLERLLNSSLVYVGEGRVMSRSFCEMRVFLDGRPVEQSFRRFSATGGLMLDRMITPEQIEGVEIYRNAMDVPPEFVTQTPCGAVLVWTRRDGGQRLSWRKLAVAAGAVGALLLIAR